LVSEQLFVALLKPGTGAFVKGAYGFEESSLSEWNLRSKTCKIVENRGLASLLLNNPFFLTMRVFSVL
jgi:hypothetical protein